MNAINRHELFVLDEGENPLVGRDELCLKPFNKPIIQSRGYRRHQDP